jgi:hypothetical protein
MKSQVQEDHLRMLREHRGRLDDEIAALEKSDTAEMFEVGKIDAEIDPVYRGLSLPGAPGRRLLVGADMMSRMSTASYRGCSRPTQSTAWQCSRSASASDRLHQRVPHRAS